MNKSPMYKDVYKKLYQKRQILFTQDSQCLKELNLLLMSAEKDILIEWAFHHVEVILNQIEQEYPTEHRPRIAYERAIQWSNKEIKMPDAKQAIIACHSVAKEINRSSDQALIHAIGQGLSTIHVKTHALGLPIYELTSIVRMNPNDFENLISKKIEEYINEFHFISSNKGR